MWLTLRELKNWGRCFVLGGENGIVFNSRRDKNDGAYTCNFDSCGSNQNAGKVLEQDKQYYIAISFEADGNGGVTVRQYLKEAGANNFLWTNTYTKDNWSLSANVNPTQFWLAHSTDSTGDLKADYDEVRVWDGVLTANQIAFSSSVGPDAEFGRLNVASGATLAIPSVAAVDLSTCKATLAAGSTLSFRLAGETNAVLKLAEIDLPETGTVTVEFDENSTPAENVKYKLVSGANLADASKFSLAPGTKGCLKVENGELVYTLISYFCIRISDNAPSLTVPFEWALEKGVLPQETDLESGTAAISSVGANGIPVWQSYCLGLEPNEAESVVLCEAAANQPPAGKVGIAARNLNVPEGLSGVTVTAYLDKSTNGIDWSPAVSSATVSSGSAVFEPEIGDGISFFE